MIFSTLFLLSLGGLIVSLLLQTFWNKWPRFQAGSVLFFFCCTVLLLLGMILERFYGNRFSFLQPIFLGLLVLPIIILILRVFNKRKFSAALPYPLTGQLPDYISLSAFLNKWLCLALTLTALSLFIIALARPVTVNTTKLPPTQGIDIMMIVDVSGSMSNQDFYPNRFVAAQKTAIDFIGKRYNDRIGLVTFARYASLAAPLTLDHEALQELVASLFLGIIDPNATAIGDALGLAANHLKESSAKSKIILFLTDGSNNAGVLDPMLAAKAAATYGFKVYTIATASPPGTTVFSSREDEIDEGLLMSIAKETGGEFYRAKNELELQDIYNKINEMETTDFTQTALISRSDVYRPFLIAGLVLLLVALFLRKLIFIKVPEYEII